MCALNVLHGMQEVIQAYKNGQATIEAQPSADIWSFGVRPCLALIASHASLALDTLAACSVACAAIGLLSP